MSYKILSKSFYDSKDITSIARRLLGKLIVRRVGNEQIIVRIVETEAYEAPEDRGSHAYQFKRSPKNETMYAAPGTAYVYICYGIHDMFNVVTGPKEWPHAILIRGVEPVLGVNIMLKNRKMKTVKRNLTAGPGLLCQALGITKSLNGVNLADSSAHIYIADDGFSLNEYDIIASPRVGMNFEGPWKLIPYRYRIKGNPWTSPAK